jgi:hypothetical protein
MGGRAMRAHIKAPSLAMQLLIWIASGLLLLFAVTYFASAHLCNFPISKDDSSAEQSQSKQDSTSLDHLVDEPTSHDIAKLTNEAANARVQTTPRNPPLPSFICDAKLTDLGVVFFTFCLVIVGWFGIKRSDQTFRRMERAYIFAGPYQPAIVGGRTITHISIENFGRSPGILKEAYGEFSTTEPVDNIPTYKHGSARKFDNAIPPVQPRAPNYPPPTIPTAWDSPFAGDQYFFGYIVYLDIFREEHRSRFCSKIFPSSKNSDIAGSPNWNDWT